MCRIFLFIITMTMVAGLGAQPLKQSFGQSGKLRIAADDFNEVADLVTDNDTLYLLTYSGHSDTNWFDMNVSVIKLNPLGSPASGFGNGGILSFDFDGMEYSTSRNMVRCSDGSFLVTGTGYSLSNTSDLPLCITRLTREGRIDSAFGTNGTAKIYFYGISEFPGALAEDAAGRMMIAGGTYDTIGNHNIPVAARYNIGSPDSTFGGTGRVAIDFTAGLQSFRTGNGFSAQHLTGGEAYDLLLLPGGKILVGGSYGPDCFLLMLNNDGSPDTTFATSGYKVFRVDPLYNNRVDKMLLLADGTILAGIAVEKNIGRDYELLRLAADGSEQNSGFVDFSFSNDWLSDMTTYSTGGFITAGRTIAPANATTPGYRSDFFALCIISDEEQLMQQNQLLVSFDSLYQNGAMAVTTQSDGTIIAAGFVMTATPGHTENAVIAIDPNLLNVHEIAKKEIIHAAPNPAAEAVFVQFPVEGGSWQLLDAAGRLLRGGSDESGKTSIDIQSLDPGIYFLNWKKENRSAIQKIIKVN